MENIALIGIDLGKNSFHIHCQDRRALLQIVGGDKLIIPFC